MKPVGSLSLLVLAAPLAAAFSVVALPVKVKEPSAAAPPHQEEGAPERAAGAHTIAVAAPLEGVWRELRPGPGGDSLVEELWSAPHGDNVVGAFRWLGPDGRASMYEILTITEEEDGVFLRLRHFGADLEAWEERDEPKTLRLAEASPTRLRFVAHAHGGDLASVTYDRSQADLLEIEVAFTEASSRAPLRLRLRRAG